MVEFGDGQANAAPSFEWWSAKRPPVVAALIDFDSGPSRIDFRFDRAHHRERHCARHHGSRPHGRGRGHLQRALDLR